jgi:DNA-binding IclR family transcriptional regulator
MGELRPPDPVWSLYLARRLGLRTAQQQRALAGLLTDSRRPNRVIADGAGCDESTVRRLRHMLEDAGVIGAWRSSSARPPLPSSAAARSLLAADPSRSSQAIAALAGTAQTSVSDIRHAMEAAREICAWRYGQHHDGCWCASAAPERTRRTLGPRGGDPDPAVAV